MEHPKRQIPQVIHLLTQGSPVEQKEALDNYFLEDASFYHPLCRVSSFTHLMVPLIGEINSRWVIWMIYRWYKILSPRIDLAVECGEYNQEASILFVEIHQIFSPFFIPFYEANVHLTTKLLLHHAESDGKYYIQSQEDMYQLNEVVKFFWPGGATLVSLWQCFATLLCIAGAIFLAPVTWFEQRRLTQLKQCEKLIKGA